MNFSDLPKKIKILDTTYKIEYVDNVIDVDIHKRSAAFGQIDFWTRTIRIYKKDRTPEDCYQTLIHEILHAITEKMGMNDVCQNEDIINKLATGINTIIKDNYIKKD